MKTMLIKQYSKPSVLTGILYGYGLSLIFIFIEYILSGLSHTTWWTYIDGGLRLISGIASLLILKKIYGDNFSSLFRNKVTKTVILCIIPVFIYFIVEFSYFLSAKQIVTSNLAAFFTMWITQITTGLFEEAASRGILMSGMMLKWKTSVKGRICSIILTGLMFGSLHVLGFIYGTNIEECLWNGLYTFTWGMFIAAIYMLSENLLLVMFIHTIWDIIVRVPRYFTDGYNNGILLNITQVSEDILSLAVFPVMAVLICIFAFKDK